MARRLEGARGDYFRDYDTQDRRYHLHILRRPMNLSRCSFGQCVQVCVVQVVNEIRPQDPYRRRLVVFNGQDDDLRRRQRIIFSFLFPTTHRRYSGKLFKRTVVHRGFQGSVQVFLAVDVRYVCAEVARVVGEMLVSNGGLGLGERSKGRFIRVPLSVFGPVLFPDPCFEEGVVMSECFHLLLCGLNCFRIGTKVVRRGRCVEDPAGGILLAFFRVPGSDARVRRRQSGARVDRFFMVLRPHSAGDHRRIPTGRARFYFQVFLCRNARWVEYIRVT